ncbi:Rho guanine nucleotide exchange factor 7 [Trichostrongylus colubriformis]|uniref:Rho guanine nucleotide exchange factor 7 n=1 Tax=Trichostrongylus colubriformis TaxID=6319 RepID=A0AAN8J3C5_TRICO
MAETRVDSLLAEPTVIVAKAKFSFEGKNNDELSFSKNDMITITQQIEGGWWEGTINGKTGWFPANYASIITEKDKLMRSKSVPNATALANGINAANGISVSGDVVNSNASRSQFRAEIMRDFIRSEEAYVSSVQRTHEELLLPIRASGILSPEDYSVLSCYIEDIAALQRLTLHRLKDALSLDISQQRIGGILISCAAELKRLLMAYCENHPKAVEVLNEKMDAVRRVLLEHGRDVPTLIAGLSEPFRHLDKYPTVLQELERNMPEGHVDRGDVQRSCAVFKEMKALCEAVRKQKELQLELLYTGLVEGWASFEQRGRILYVGVVPLTCDGVCDDRCLALFSKMLLVLEITLDINSYRLLRKVSTQNLRVRCLEHRAGLAVGDMELSISTTFDLERWLEAFSRCEGTVIEDNSVMTPPALPQSYAISNMHILSPSRKADISELPTAERAVVGRKASIGNNELRLNHELEMILPDDADEPDLNVSSRRSLGDASKKVCFRVVPPHRHVLAGTTTSKKNVKMRKEVNVGEQHDAQLLRIIEAYCSGAARGAAVVPDCRPPQLIVAEDEKILVEEVVGDEIIIQEKSLVDTVYALKDQVAGLRQELATMNRALDREQRARRRLEELVRRGSMNAASPVSTPRPTVEMTTSQ